MFCYNHYNFRGKKLFAFFFKLVIKYINMIMDDDYWYRNKDGSTCVVYKLGDVYFSSIKSRIKYFSHQQQLQENERIMRERESNRRPNSVQLKNVFKNHNSNNSIINNNLIMVESLQDQSENHGINPCNFKKNIVYNRFMPNYAQQNVPISNSNSSKDNVSMCSVNSISLRNSKRVSQILRKFSTELSNSKDEIPPNTLKHRHSHSSGTSSSLTRKILSHDKQRSNSSFTNYVTENSVKPSTTSISDDLIASFQTVPSDALKSQIYNRNRKLFNSQLKNIELNPKKKNNSVKHVQSTTSVSSSIPVSISLTKSSSLSSIETKIKKEDEVQPNFKTNFTFKYESPRRRSMGSVMRTQKRHNQTSQKLTNEKNDFVKNDDKNEILKDSVDSTINVVGCCTDKSSNYENTKVVQDDDENKKMIDESSEDKLITNLFHPILSSLDANDEEFNDEAITAKVKSFNERKTKALQEEEKTDKSVNEKVKLSKSQLSASTLSVISIAYNDSSKINNYSTDSSVRTHSSLLVYQNEIENHNLDFTDNDALSNISLTNIDDVENVRKSICENKKESNDHSPTQLINKNENNFYENEAIYENVPQQERKQSDVIEFSDKSERKNSILLDKILFNDIQIFRIKNKNDKYYVPRYVCILDISEKLYFLINLINLIVLSLNLVSIQVVFIQSLKIDRLVAVLIQSLMQALITTITVV